MHKSIAHWVRVWRCGLSIVVVSFGFLIPIKAQADWIGDCMGLYMRCLDRCDAAFKNRQDMYLQCDAGCKDHHSACLSVEGPSRSKIPGTKYPNTTGTPPKVAH
jgi:hypothetical protein